MCAFTCYFTDSYMSIANSIGEIVLILPIFPPYKWDVLHAFFLRFALVQDFFLVRFIHMHVAD